jgi:hypothetical protein
MLGRLASPVGTVNTSEKSVDPPEKSWRSLSSASVARMAPASWRLSTVTGVNYDVSDAAYDVSAGVDLHTQFLVQRRSALPATPHLKKSEFLEIRGSIFH